MENENTNFDLDALRKEYPDAIFTNAEYDEKKNHLLAKAGLWEIPDENATVEEFNAYKKKCAEIVGPIWEQRYRGYHIAAVESMPPMPIEIM